VNSHKSPDWVERYNQAKSMQSIPARIARETPLHVVGMEARVILMSIAAAVFSMQKYTAKMSRFTDHYN